MTIKTILSKLITKKEEPGGYIVLVFRDLENGGYLMCTKLPNWGTITPTIEEIGFLQCREFIAGKDTWCNSSSGSQIPYCYTGIYFWDFVPSVPKIKKELTLD